MPIIKDFPTRLPYVVRKALAVLVGIFVGLFAAIKREGTFSITQATSYRNDCKQQAAIRNIHKHCKLISSDIVKKAMDENNRECS